MEQSCVVTDIDIHLVNLTIRNNLLLSSAGLMLNPKSVEPFTTQGVDVDRWLVHVVPCFRVVM